MNDAPYDIILSGPITGIEDYVQRFAIAYVLEREAFRKATGREANVFNPAALPDGYSNEWYMKRCVAAIFDSQDAVLAQLNGWMDSKGARAEHALCVSLGRVIREQCSDGRTRQELITVASDCQVMAQGEGVSG